MELEDLRSGEEKYTVAGYEGVAFYFAGPNFVEYYNGDRIDEWDECELIEDGQARMVMVGDDRVHIIDPVDITLIEGDVCSCGQTNCGFDVDIARPMPMSPEFRGFAE